MFKNKKFVKFCLRFMCWFRKIYSPVIFWLLWFLFIRWTISVEDKYAARVIWEEMLHSSTTAEFREKLKRYDWLPERKGGLLDFTYRLPWLNFCGGDSSFSKGDGIWTGECTKTGLRIVVDAEEGCHAVNPLKNIRTVVLVNETRL